MKLHALLLVLALVSCEKRAELLEGAGNVKSPGGTWDVTVTSNSLNATHRKKTKIELGPGASATFTGGLAPGDWSLDKGAFVYFDGSDRMWAFDGTSHSFICEKKGGNVSGGSFETHDQPFPEQVLKRLPEPLAARYRARATKP